MEIDRLLNLRYDAFTENEKYVCHYLSSHLFECCSKSVDAFAQDCHVSKTLLVRFAQKLGFSGYSEMKAQIKLDLQERISDSDSLLNHITGSYNKMMDDLLKKDLSHFFSLLENARRVFVFGSGSSQVRVAGEMKRIFLPVREMIHLQGHDICRALYEIATPQDAVILISLSGESDAVVSLARELRTRSVPAISITRLKSNALASLCEENLYIASTCMTVAPGIEYETATPYFILIEFLYLSYQNYLLKR
ncbi:MAG: MurR/RpiR family transcriptional regulator [Oscillospiraceae bacterium]|nr:MurR/RpiR family transcriptional regulator [Oscillospiraceae bacterium]